MLAKDIMTTRVITVQEDTPVEEIARTLLEFRISAAPVVDRDDRMVGIVSEGDLVHRPDVTEDRDDSWWLSVLADTEERARRYAKARGQLAKDVMSTPVLTAEEDDTVASMAAMLEEYRIKRLPVVSHGKVVGIVSRANLLHALASVPADTGGPKRNGERPTTSHPPDDAEIRATILNRVHNDISVRGAVNAIVAGGVVDLWGGVETEAQRQAVRSAAESAPNVVAVKDHLTVFSPALRHLLGADRSD